MAGPMSGVGVPYSDPSMDGGGIQEATLWPLGGRTRVADTFRHGRGHGAAGATRSSWLISPSTATESIASHRDLRRPASSPPTSFPTMRPNG